MQTAFAGVGMGPDLEGLSVIAEVAIGLAGFSGVFVAVTHNAKFDPPDRMRLQMTLSSSFICVLLSLLPFAVLEWADELAVGWQRMSAIALIMSLFQFQFSLRRSIPVQRAYPDVIPMPMIILQAGMQVIGMMFFAMSGLGDSEQAQYAYIAGLLAMLAISMFGFLRLMFFRREE